MDVEPRWFFFNLRVILLKAAKESNDLKHSPFCETIALPDKVTAISFSEFSAVPIVQGAQTGNYFVQ